MTVRELKREFVELLLQGKRLIPYSASVEGNGNGKRSEA
jgi:hypothetical protein